MTQSIMTLNAGSSSVKFSLYGVEADRLAESPLASGKIAIENDHSVLTLKKQGAPVETRRLDAAGADAVAQEALNLMDELAEGKRIAAIGHRIVHGGPQFAEPQIITASVEKELQRLVPLAPQHQPHGLRLAAAAKGRWLAALQVACFDTAFHRTLPREAQLFALPRKYAEEGILRYGFHGLSYEYVAGAAPALTGGAPHGRMIVAHLGSGASLCAIRDGKSVATTMGFTALDGLPMATRCGAIDPGVLLYLIQEKRMTPAEVESCLYNESGLLGVSGVSGDIRDLEQSAEPRAEEALAFFAYRIVLEIGALAAALGGVDALVFTAGVGENSPSVRARVIGRLEWLGFRLATHLNQANAARITENGAHPSAYVVQTNEELVIARGAFSQFMNAR